MRQTLSLCTTGKSQECLTFIMQNSQEKENELSISTSNQNKVTVSECNGQEGSQGSLSDSGDLLGVVFFPPSNKRLGFLKIGLRRGEAGGSRVAKTKQLQMDFSKTTSRVQVRWAGQNPAVERFLSSGYSWGAGHGSGAQRELSLESTRTKWSPAWRD